MQTSATGHNPVIASILEKHPAQLDFLPAAVILGYTSDAAYVARSRGLFPVRVRRLGGSLIIFTSDLVEYLQTGISQAELSVKPIRKSWKIRTGRPSKREELEAKSQGLTVKELRAQTNQLKTKLTGRTERRTGNHKSVS